MKIKQNPSSPTATKFDIKSLEQSTRVDNKKLRGEFGKLRGEFSSIKSEFKSTKKSLFEQMLKLEEKIENVEERLGVKIEKILSAVSNFAGRVETLETENEIGTDQIRRVSETVNNHEKRINHLESARQAA